MSSTDLRDVTAGLGPGTRGNGCDICMEEMGVKEDTLTHTTCENTFHKTCFGEWIKSNDPEDQTCPKCREILNERALNDGAVIFWEMFFDTPDSSLPPGTPSSTEPRLTTRLSDMYDFDVSVGDHEDEGFPTPAFLRYFHTNQHLATLWLGDYFIRMRRGQSLTIEEVIARILECYERMDNEISSVDVGDIEDELEEGDVLTDLEIINESGQRRIRSDVADLFKAEPQRAYDWLERHMTRTQRDLGLYPNSEHYRRTSIRNAYDTIQARCGAS